MDYTPLRKRNIYIPGQENPFALSRSKVELFLECPRCFYLDRCRGLVRPPTFPFNLNLAVDHLLKREFDTYRAKQEPHPLMGEGELGFEHPEMATWQENFGGIRFHHQDTNLILTGAVDDVWVKDGKLIVVDYKATASDYNLTYKGPKYDRYKRQLDFYTYLLKENGFPVSEEAVFVVCNGDRSKSDFGGCLHFKQSIIRHKVDMSWIEDTIFNIFETLQESEPPAPSAICHYCQYVKERNNF